MRIGPGDDAAVLDDGTALTTDAMVEGVHWDDRLSPEDVGWKVVAVNASDLGAIGAKPAWMLLSIALPGHLDEAWVTAFSRGLHAAMREWGVALAGGDTVRTPGPRFISVAMGGPCVGEPIGRGGGRPGDDLWVTGTPGLAGAGWVLKVPPPAALSALRRPRPPVAFALDVARERLATAMMDLSDGLESDLPRLCARSGCGAELRLDDLPVADALRDVDVGAVVPVLAMLQLAAGDDYELLIAASPSSAGDLTSLAERHGVRLTRVGRLVPRGVTLLSSGTPIPWPVAPWTHFTDVPS